MPDPAIDLTKTPTQALDEAERQWRKLLDKTIAERNAKLAPLFERKHAYRDDEHRARHFGRQIDETMRAYEDPIQAYVRELVFIENLRPVTIVISASP